MQSRVFFYSSRPASVFNSGHCGALQENPCVADGAPVAGRGSGSSGTWGEKWKHNTVTIYLMMMFDETSLSCSQADDAWMRWPVNGGSCIRSSGIRPLDSTSPGVERLRPKAAVRPCDMSTRCLVIATFKSNLRLQKCQIVSPYFATFGQRLIHEMM